MDLFLERNLSSFSHLNDYRWFHDALIMKAFPPLKFLPNVVCAKNFGMILCENESDGFQKRLLLEAHEFIHISVPTVCMYVFMYECMYLCKCIYE